MVGIAAAIGMVATGRDLALVVEQPDFLGDRIARVDFVAMNAKRRHPLAEIVVGQPRQK